MKAVQIIDTSGSMIPLSVSEISGCGAFCDEDVQDEELGVLVVGCCSVPNILELHKERGVAKTKPADARKGKIWKAFSPPFANESRPPCPAIPTAEETSN